MAFFDFSNELFAFKEDGFNLSISRFCKEEVKAYVFDFLGERGVSIVNFGSDLSLWSWIFTGETGWLYESNFSFLVSLKCLGEIYLVEI